MLEALLLKGKKGPSPVGQIRFNGRPRDMVLDTTWIVPENVYSICGVSIAPSPNKAGLGGGGLSWRNDIPVIPGEKLRAKMGSTDEAPAVLTRENGEVLLIAYPPKGQAGGKGGKDADPINDGGGNGGNGVSATNASGGAGGYSGNGGNGATTNTGSGYPGKGGGGGGSSKSGRGGGTLDIGQGENGVGGVSSVSNGFGGQGSRASGLPVQYSIAYGGMGGTGSIRLIWGPNRAFPSTNTTIM